MKKPAAVLIAIFIAVFLIWPTTKYDQITGCYDGNDCAPAEVFNSLGGGYQYINEAISSGTLKQPEIGRYSLYEINSDPVDLSFFRPLQALRAAAIASVISLIAIIYISKRKPA